MNHTQRAHDVYTTSMQRHDVASTLRRHCIDVMCLLGMCFIVLHKSNLSEGVSKNT